MQQVGLYIQLQHLTAHALVGTQIVETAHADLMGHGSGVLTVIVDAAAAPHLTGTEIVDARGVVVAIGTTGLIIGMLLVDGSANAIDAMNLPGETQTKSLLSRQRLEEGIG